MGSEGGTGKADSWQTNLLQAQIVTTLSDFHNFNLSATYANWDVAGSDPFNGGSGFTPVITSGPINYRIVAEGYGSGAYDFATPLSARVPPSSN